MLLMFFIFFFVGLSALQLNELRNGKFHNNSFHYEASIFF
jgi:hypothetical protein